MKVASTTSGRWCLRATSATAAMSVKSRTGLPMVSMKMRRVFALIALSNALMSWWSTKRVVTPNCGRIASNIV